MCTWYTRIFGAQSEDDQHYLSLLSSFDDSMEVTLDIRTLTLVALVGATLCMVAAIWNVINPEYSWRLGLCLFVVWVHGALLLAMDRLRTPAVPPLLFHATTSVLVIGAMCILWLILCEVSKPAGVVMVRLTTTCIVLWFSGIASMFVLRTA
jgi:uncharacterized membrane protein